MGRIRRMHGEDRKSAKILTENCIEEGHLET